MDHRILQYQFIKRLKSFPFVDEIWLFGSRARDDNQARSDIDLAIVCPKATYIDWLKIVDTIDDADTLLKIDCIRFKKGLISQPLYENLLKDKEVIYVKNAA